MRTLKVVLCYDGTDFSGWQRQPALRTVQQVFEEAVKKLTGAASPTNASGRTDAGVHAIGQVIHFHTASAHSVEVFHKALNATLPADIRVRTVADVPQSFHATLDARAKTYRYAIDNGPIADPFALRTTYHVHRRLDEAAMQRAGQALLGRHDFRSFETNWPNRTSSVRTISRVAVERIGSRVRIEVEADGFLYNMVRSITGTLIQVGIGRKPEPWVGEALRAESRAVAGPTAPPQGLFLLKVRYGADYDPEDA